MLRAILEGSGVLNVLVGAWSQVNDAIFYLFSLGAMFCKLFFWLH